jgi:hypothetical protein
VKNDAPRRLSPFDVQEVSETKKYAKTDNLVMES